MAFFKFRWPIGGGESSEKAAKRSRSSQAESIELMRRRARHRLIGAAFLILLGIVGFPVLFDTQPRSIPVDIPIEIPDRNKVVPLSVPGPAKSSVADLPEKPPVTVSKTAAEASLSGVTEGEEILGSGAVSGGGSKPSVATKPDAKLMPSPVPAVVQGVSPNAEAKIVRPDRTEDSARARALLEGRDGGSVASAPGSDDGRFIVQVGAFADAEKAREVRQKVERSGLKTYTQVVDTKDGKRTRVRVGPFVSRAEADKAAGRIKALDLSASVLAL